MVGPTARHVAKRVAQGTASPLRLGQIGGVGLLLDGFPGLVRDPEVERFPRRHSVLRYTNVRHDRKTLVLPSSAMGRRLRCGLTLAIGTAVSILLVGLVGQLPHWGETAPTILGLALLGLWQVSIAALAVARRSPRSSGSALS